MSRFLCVGSAFGAIVFAAVLIGLGFFAVVFFGFVFFAVAFLVISTPELALDSEVTLRAVSDGSAWKARKRLRRPRRFRRACGQQPAPNCSAKKSVSCPAVPILSSRGR